MNIQKISEKDLVHSTWAGGTTTQVYISPENSVFTERKFDFRISSAVIAIEESDFTPFPGFSRILMVLEGELEIFHEGQFSKVLQPFESYHFSGDWKTSAKGKVIDFNLIMGEGISGEMNYICLKENSVEHVILHNDTSSSALTVGYYLVSGGIQIHLNQEEYELEKGGMILIESNFELDKIGVVGIGELIEILIW